MLHVGTPMSTFSLWFYGCDPPSRAGVIEGGAASKNTLVVAVDHHDQPYALPALSANGLKFDRKPLADELLSRSPAMRGDYGADVAYIPSVSQEELLHERLVLTVFAEQHDADIAAHRSQPRAISSDSLRPQSGKSGDLSGATVTADASRCSSSPLSGPK